MLTYHIGGDDNNTAKTAEANAQLNQQFANQPLETILAVARQMLPNGQVKFDGGSYYATKPAKVTIESCYDGGKLVIVGENLDEADCLWLLDNHNLLEKDLCGKFRLVIRLNRLRLIRLGMQCSRYKIVQLMPCIGSVPNKYGSEDRQFPIRDSAHYLEMCAQHHCQILVFDAKQDYTGRWRIDNYHAILLNGLYGVEMLPQGSEDSYIDDPANWYLQPDFQFGSKFPHKPVEESEYDHQAYALALGIIPMPPSEGKLYRAHRMLSVLFGHRNWRESIIDKSYRTMRQGPIGNYSGGAEYQNATHKVRVWGTRAGGDAWYAESGGIYYQITPK